MELARTTTAATNKKSAERRSSETISGPSPRIVQSSSLKICPEHSTFPANPQCQQRSQRTDPGQQRGIAPVGNNRSQQCARTAQYKNQYEHQSVRTHKISFIAALTSGNYQVLLGR